MPRTTPAEAGDEKASEGAEEGVMGGGRMWVRWAANLYATTTPPPHPPRRVLLADVGALPDRLALGYVHEQSCHAT